MVASIFINSSCDINAQKKLLRLGGEKVKQNIGFINVALIKINIFMAFLSCSIENGGDICFQCPPPLTYVSKLLKLLCMLCNSSLSLIIGMGFAFNLGYVQFCQFCLVLMHSFAVFWLWN